MMKLIELLKQLIKNYFNKEGFSYYVTKQGCKNGNLKIYRAKNNKTYLMINGRYTFLTNQQVEDLNIQQNDIVTMITPTKPIHKKLLYD